MYSLNLWENFAFYQQTWKELRKGRTQNEDFEGEVVEVRSKIAGKTSSRRQSKRVLMTVRNV